jgi:hypothetical protein
LELFLDIWRASTSCLWNIGERDRSENQQISKRQFHDSGWFGQGSAGAIPDQEIHAKSGGQHTFGF